MYNFVPLFVGILSMFDFNSMLKVDKELFIRCLQEIEKNGPLCNMDALCKVLTEFYNKEKGPLYSILTYSSVAFHITKWDLGHKTPKTTQDLFLDSEHPSISKELVLVKNVSEDKQIPAQEAPEDKSKRLNIPVKYLWIYDLSESGDIGASIARKCLDCSSYDSNEIANCPLKSCGLYKHRPFRSLLPPEKTKENKKNDTCGKAKCDVKKEKVIVTESKGQVEPPLLIEKEKDEVILT